MIYESIDPGFLKTKLDYIDLSISGLRDAIRGSNTKDFSTVQTTLDNIYAKTDVALSTLLSQSAFTTRWDSGIYGFDGTIARKILVDSNGKLIVTGTVTTSISEVKVWDGTDYLAINTDGSLNVNNIDTALSTRLSDSTFTGRWDGGIYGFDGTTARKIKTDTSGKLQVDVLSTANPSNLDVALSTRLAESTFTGRFPAASALGDSMSNPTTTTIGSALLGFDGTNWERVYTDGSNRLKVTLDSIPNPSNLDAALSTRATESTLSTLSGKFPSASALSDSMSNPTTTTIGSALLGFDGTNWRRITALNKDISGSTRNAITTIPSGSPMDITRMPYEVDSINVTSTESSTSISAPGAKYLILVNKGDTDILFGINASVPGTNPMKLRARCMKILPFGGATSVYYKTASGTSTLSIGYMN